MRIPTNHVRLEADETKKFGDAVVALGSGHFRKMNLQGLTDDLANGQPRIQRAEGILKNHLDLTPERAELRLAHREDVRSLISNDPGRRRRELQERSPNSRFPTPALTDQSNRLPSLDGKRYPVDRSDFPGAMAKDAPVNRKPRAKILDLKK
jgi:hypothetical protein